jgi:hypothetical protein
VPQRTTFAQNPPSGRLVEDLRIGSLDDAHGLDFISALDVDARGNIYVTQPRSDYHVRVFDPSGKWIEPSGAGVRGRASSGVLATLAFAQAAVTGRVTGPSGHSRRPA